MTPLTQVAVSTAATTTSVVTLSLAIGAPLLTVANIYDLHLFPKADELTYDSSTTHLASQILHCMALGFFTSMFLATIVSLPMLTRLSDRTQRSLSAGLAIMASFGFLCHLLGIATLIKVGMEWKKKLDSLPIPPPDIHIDYRVGLYADVIGLLASTVSAILAGVALFAITRHRFIRLE